MKCNMCDGELKHYNFNGTFIWICEDCPNVQFEFIDMIDINNLKFFLEKRNETKEVQEND